MKRYESEHESGPRKKSKKKKEKDKKERKDNVFVEWQGTRTHPATSQKKIAN